MGPNAERDRESMQIVDPDIILPAFQFADLVLWPSHALGKFFLRQRERLAQAPHAPGQNAPRRIGAYLFHQAFYRAAVAFLAIAYKL